MSSLPTISELLAVIELKKMCNTVIINIGNSQYTVKESDTVDSIKTRIRELYGMDFERKYLKLKDQPHTSQ